VTVPNDPSARPVAIVPNPDGIPQVLKDANRWGTWGYEERTAKDQEKSINKKRWAKRPFRIIGVRAASTNDPEGWGTFKLAWWRYQKNKDSAARLAKSGKVPHLSELSDGLGFLFVEGDGFCGIDLDDCRDPVTGVIAPWAWKIILALASYAEVSPSGTGVKIIIRGYIAGGGRRVKYQGGEVEVYCTGRFFAITGVRVEGTPPTVEDAQAALDALIEEVFPARGPTREQDVAAIAASRTLLHHLGDDQLVAKMMENDKTAALMRGDLSSHKGDHSRADLALANHLCFFTGGDAQRIDRIFRASALMRPKWDERRGDLAYGERTIRQALRDWDGTCYDPNWRPPRPAVNATVDTQLAGTPQAEVVADPSSAGLAGDDQAANNTPPPTAPQQLPRLGGEGGSGDSNPPSTSGRGGRLRPHYLRNYITTTQVLEGEQRHESTGLEVQAIYEGLMIATCGWPRRVAGRLFAPHSRDGVTILKKECDLFSWIGETLSAHNVAAEAGVRKHPIDWIDNGPVVKQGEFHSYMLRTAMAYESVERYPHACPQPGAYYCDRPCTGGDGAALNGFLAFFTMASDADRDLLLAFLLTTVWGREPGQSPAFVFDVADNQGRGRGAGKSTIPQKVGSLFGGHISRGKRDNFEKFKTRLLSSGCDGKRVVLLDNLKADVFSDEDLESLITDRIVNGHRMYDGDATVTNNFVYCITCNGVQLSDDLASRSVFIDVARHTTSGRWNFEIDQYIDAHRWAIFGDLLAIFARPARPPARIDQVRWGGWTEEVLGRVGNPDAALQAIIERRRRADGDAATHNYLFELIHEYLRRAGFTNPKQSYVHFRNHQFARILEEAGIGSSDDGGRAVVRVGPNQVKGIVTRLKLSCLVHDKEDDHAGVYFRGEEGEGFSQAQQFDDPALPRDPVEFKKAMQSKVTVQVHTPKLQSYSNHG